MRHFGEGAGILCLTVFTVVSTLQASTSSLAGLRDLGQSSTARGWKAPSRQCGGGALGVWTHTTTHISYENVPNTELPRPSKPRNINSYPLPSSSYLLTPCYVISFIPSNTLNAYRNVRKIQCSQRASFMVI